MRKFTIYSLLVIFIYTSVPAQESLHGISPINLKSEKDIDRIIEQIGNKKIVAIGEDTHGTTEYYQLRAAITKRLIEKKGFNTFILENPHEDMMVLQQQLYKVPLDTLMKRHLFSIYQTRDMKDFLVFLKRSISKRKDFVIAGADDSYRELLPAMLKKELRQYKNSRLDELADDFEKRQLLDIESYYKLPGKLKPDSLPDDLQFGFETLRRLNTLDSLYRKYPKNKKLDELIFHAKSNYIFYDYFIRNAYISRDEVMGMRVNYYTQQKNAKVIIWAHNGHIPKSPFDKEIGMMGATIERSNPGNYFSIGLITTEGSYSYINNRFINDNHVFGDTLFHTEFLEINKNSWNAILASQKHSNFTINFSKLSSEEQSFFNSKKPLRIIGYQKEKPLKTTYFDVPLLPLYDLVVFLKRTSHTSGIFFQPRK